MTGTVTALQVYGAIALSVVGAVFVAWVCRSMARDRVNVAVRNALDPPAGTYRVETLHEGVWVPWSIAAPWKAAEDEWWRAVDEGHIARIGRAA